MNVPPPPKWPPPPPPLASTGEVPRETITARAAKDAVIFLKVEVRIDDSFRSLV
jgi:hypothetical protein